MTTSHRSTERYFPWLAVLLVTLMACIVASDVLAQSGELRAPRTGRPRRTDALDYVTIDVREKDLREVLQGIGRQVDVNIVADPEVDEKVTLSLDGVEWRHALKLIARQTSCIIIEESPRLIRFSQPPDISMEFQDAELKVVLDLLAKQAGANIVIAEDVVGKVTLSLRKVPWRVALDTIVKTAGYVTVEEYTAATEIIRVVRRDTLSRQLETMIHQLRYIRPKEQYLARIAGVETLAVDRKAEGAGSEEEFGLLVALRRALSDEGVMDFDNTTNTLIIKDVRPRLTAIRKIIDILDVEQALVRVDVKFISTTSDDILETGLKFDLPNTPAREGLKISAVAPDPQIPFTADPSGEPGIATRGLLEYGGTYPFD
ncbi:MAG: hypothetical protein V3T77_00435, partial [Planctomycetota bacterium]